MSWNDSWNASTMYGATGTCCSVLQRVAVCCTLLQHPVCHSDEARLQRMTQLERVAVCCNVLQCVATCCSVLQRVAVCCNVLQCVAPCCSVLTMCLDPVRILDPSVEPDFMLLLPEKRKWSESGWKKNNWNPHDSMSPLTKSTCLFFCKGMRFSMHVECRGMWMWIWNNVDFKVCGFESCWFESCWAPRHVDFESCGFRFMWISSHGECRGMRISRVVEKKIISGFRCMLSAAVCECGFGLMWISRYVDSNHVDSSHVEHWDMLIWRWMCH